MAVVRDVYGNVHVAAWRTITNVASAEEAEALACLDGIRLAVEVTSSPTVVETDCSTLVQAMNGQ
jgi:ribonuclease HI